MDEEFQGTADTQRCREIPQPEILGLRAVVGFMQTIDPLQSAVQRKAPRLPVSSQEKLMFGCGSERAAGMKETVVGIQPQMPHGYVEGKELKTSVLRASRVDIQRAAIDHLCGDKVLSVEIEHVESVT